jgi:mannosyltransferase
MWSCLTEQLCSIGAWTKRAVVSRWVLLPIILVSFVLRLHDLGAKSLWADEGMTLGRAEQPIASIFQNVNLIPLTPDYHDGTAEKDEVFRSPDLHPPLYFLLMHFWILWAGKSEFAVRFLSLAAVMLIVPLVFVLGRALLSKEAGIWAALLASFSPFYTWHAQEARMYGWVAALSLASVYAFLPLLRSTPRRRDYISYVAATAALLYTHYSGFWLLGFEMLLYGSYRLRRHPKRALLIAAFLTVALIPLIPFVWQTLQRGGVFPLSYHPLHLILIESSNHFSLGPSEPVVRPLWQIAPFLVLFAVGVLMQDVRHRRRAWVVCLGYLILPILLQYVVSFVRPNYTNPRHLTVVSPAWGLVVGQGLATMRRRWWPGWAVALGAVLLFSGWASYDIFTAHGMWKDDIRGAVRYIEARARPGDAIILHDPVIRLTFDYYYDGDYPETAIPTYGEYDEHGQDAALEEFADWAQRYNRVWFLYGPPPIAFPFDLLPGWADTHLFKVCQRGFEAQWTYVGVAAYDDAPPLFDALPDGAASLDVDYGGLRLVGFSAPQAAAGENAWLEFYWQVEGELPDEPLTLAVRLRDGAGEAWLEQTKEVLPFYPQAAWPGDQVVMTEFRMPLPDDMPPISFAVEVEPVGLGDGVVAGQVAIARPETRDTAPPPRARFEGGLELLAGELAGDRFRAGHPLVGSLSWRAASPPGDDYEVSVRLTDLLGREVARNQMSLSAAGFPTSAWLPDDRVAGRLSLLIPAGLRGGTYRVQVGLLDAGGAVVPVSRWYGSRDWAAVGTVRVEAWPLETEVPAGIQHPLEAVYLGDDADSAIRLHGYDLACEGDELTLTLYWRAGAAPGANYHVFVHVGTTDAPPVAQADGVPVNWLRPTTSWRAGEVIADTYTVSLAGVTPGQYSLLVGMYDPAAGGLRPMTVVDGEVIPGGYVLLTVISVGE